MVIVDEADNALTTYLGVSHFKNAIEQRSNDALTIQSQSQTKRTVSVSEPTTEGVKTRLCSLNPACNSVILPTTPR